MATASAGPALGLIDHLPVLTVVIPLLAAPLCVLFGNKTLAWVIAFAASVLSFLCSAHVLLQVLDGDVISYALGGWEPPLGIEYRIDAANAILLFLISGISSIVLPYALTSGKDEIVPGANTFLLLLSFVLHRPDGCGGNG